MMSYSCFLYAVLVPIMPTQSSTPHRTPVEVEALSPEQREFYTRIESSIEKMLSQETIPSEENPQFKLNPNAKVFSPIEVLTPSECEDIAPIQEVLLEQIHSGLDKPLQEEDTSDEEPAFEQNSGFIAIYDRFTEVLDEMETGRSSYSPRVDMH